MKKVIVSLSAAAIVMLSAFAPAASSFVSKAGHVKFFSHTPAEDISANNYKVTSKVNTENGEVIFSVPMQSFEFDKSAMQKHYNSPKFLDTKQFPKAKFKGMISNLKDLDFSKDGSNTAKINGEMTMHGVSQKIEALATLTVKGETLTLESTFDLTLADYEISFVDGKPSTNIAKVVEVTVKAEHSKE